MHEKYQLALEKAACSGSFTEQLKVFEEMGRELNCEREQTIKQWKERQAALDEEVGQILVEAERMTADLIQGSKGD